MESKDDGKPGSKIPIIFRLITSFQIGNLLEEHDAKKKASKEVFLIHANTNHPGLTVISYYSQEHGMVQNLKLGLTKDGWKLGPTRPQIPSMLDSPENQEKYIKAKKKFDKDMQSFAAIAKILFEQNVSTELIKTLSTELEKNEFQLDGLIKPDPALASQEKHFLSYVSDFFISREKHNPAQSQHSFW